MTVTKKKEPDNLELWDFFKETDPNHTKSFQVKGGFSGTAIDPVYVIQKITEKFGPQGRGWWHEIIDEKYVDGGPLTKAPDRNSIIHTIRLRIAYMDGGEYARYTGPQFGCTEFVGENKWGIFTDVDHAKKSLTDALGKCAVLLGVAADVHLGKYDDNKYVKNLKEKYGDEGGSGHRPDPKKITKAPPATGGDCIQESTVKMMRRVAANKATFSEKELDSYLSLNFQIESAEKVPVDRLNEILTDLKKFDSKNKNDDVPF